jgi:hypothetical protein
VSASYVRYYRTPARSGRSAKWHKVTSRASFPVTEGCKKRVRGDWTSSSEPPPEGERKCVKCFPPEGRERTISDPEEWVSLTLRRREWEELLLALDPAMRAGWAPPEAREPLEHLEQQLEDNS